MTYTGFLRDVVRMNGATSGKLSLVTAREAAEYFRFSSVEAFRQWLYRHRQRHDRPFEKDRGQGRRKLYDLRDLELLARKSGLIDKVA